MLRKDPDTYQAVALSYSAGDEAPRVVAKGRGITAEAIIALAREHGVYVHQSPELVNMLMQVDQDRHIPVELYQAVAELLAWLYSLEQAPPVSDTAELARRTAADDV